MKTDELREKYLAYFQSQGHSRQPSDVLVPTWDPSVLFTPAGMNQFKDHFLGKVKLDFTRATTCQKCLRTGDIDNVGRTAYHHTFFEMLGNFSFGDYFKQEAVEWAWEFLTSPKWLAIDPARLKVTVYKDDNEAANIWHEKIGLPTSRISRMEEDENFWPASAPSLGPDGVCGPCSEIYYQLDNGKDVEIWNLVFTQFNRIGDPPDNLRPLPSKNIDTGMGLERTASVLQNVPTNYHIDILMPIVQAAAEVCSVHYEYESDNGRRLRRITDHVRACTFAVHENILPGPKKARYVIKRLLRRAVLDGHQMGLRDPFLHQLVPAVASAMQSAYPELSETVTRVSEIICKEESDFFSTIGGGLERIEKVFATMTSSGSVMVDGSEAANLYQTYGVPPELFQAIAAERNLTFDWDGYREEMKKHEEVSGGGRSELFQTGPIETLKEALRFTEFVGYDATQTSSVVKGIIVGEGSSERLVNEVAASAEPVRVILDRSPFYGEGGGQVGDSGTLESQGVRVEIEDTQRAGELLIHVGKVVSGKLSEGLEVTAAVDLDRRDAIRRAHSATHILHHALQSIVGAHAQQQGSKVDEDWLRFDFTNQQSLSDEEVASIEAMVAQNVQLAAPISWKTVPLVEAREAGAMMLFGEKYPDPVRMVSMGEFSRELCGGTHLTNTGQVEEFEVIAEESVSAGTRRVVALTGQRAKQYREEVQSVLSQAAEVLNCVPASVHTQVQELAQAVRGLKKQLAGGGEGTAKSVASSAAKPASKSLSYLEQRTILRDAARLLNVSTGELVSRITTLQEEFAKLQQQVEQLSSSGGVSAESLLEQATVVYGAAVVVAQTPGATPNLMRQWIDQIRQKSTMPTAVLFASQVGDDKVLLVAGVSRDLVAKGVSAGKWIGKVAPVVGGGGGGKPDLAQAGGKLPAKIPEALEAAVESMKTMLA
ncbi:alanine--tRNA ligase [Aureliella helgolandensis]|uniref:Alanine--tRNA ligase n=1 Tax=Aureliella helgolandensis TaxID=2527968 RepID=A0A518GFP2_9BACT|nr:alanine--tRNA ligase [Aureliella helgolandensis]QDV27390.1 Alanine--tRNA ligase [Aureliella helgolandensis]